MKPIAIGAMRLSTHEPRDDARAGEVLDAALAAGATWLDTADVYARDEHDLGHNERLVAAAVARHHGAPITVVTKGGLLRDGKRWIPDGRAQHLAAAARASRERLGRAIDVYLLHAPDPQVPLATSVRALARVAEDGLARRVGVSNVGRVQLAEALGIVEVAVVEVELGPHDVGPIRGGLVALCAERGIVVLAYRPFGGRERARAWGRDRELRAIAARHDATPPEVVLAWLRGLSPVIVPLPGPTTAVTAASAVRAASLALDDDARVALDRRFLGSSVGRLHRAPPPAAAAAATDREVVIVMGMPGAGKTSLAGELAARGYARFNRDERGGTVDALAVALDEALAAAPTAAVLDNTYPTRAARAPVIDVAARHGVPVRCLWLDTPIEDAQVNAAGRLLERYGRLPEPAELGKLARRDPAAFRPNAQFAWRRALEPPDLDEGFTAVERVEFVRRAAPPAAGGAPALIVDVDDVAALPDLAGALAAWARAGWFLAGTAWRPDGGAAPVLPVALPVATCTHPAGPPVCWCRKPMPGLGLVLARAHGLDLARSIHVGRGAADRGFAARLGMRFLEPEALHDPPLALH